MDISFLLYWTRNFDWALLEQCEKKVLQVQCSKFCNLLALHGREHRKGLAIYKVPESSSKKLAFLCLCVKTHCMCNFDHSFLPHLSFKHHICFSTTLVWMHSSHPANFGFHEEWLVDQILLKKLKILEGACPYYVSCTLNDGKFPFLNQIPNSFYQKFQLEIPSNSMESEF